MRQYASPADIQIGKQPNNQTCRRSNRSRPPQHKQGKVILCPYERYQKGNLVFNVWCGYPGARIRAFLMTATVKTNGAPVDAIMNYLQESDEFSEMSREFIAHFSK